MSRALFLIDIPNLFVGTRSVWPNHNLDYDKVIKMYEDVGHMVLGKVAYCSPGKPRSSTFFSNLRELGFVLDDMNQASWGLKVAEAVNYIDSLIIGTSDPFIIPLLIHARHKGIHTYVFGVGVHGHIERHAEVFEIDEDCLKSRYAAAKQVELPADVVSDAGGNDG